MKQPFFTGVCTALVTPFLDGRVNYPMAEQLVMRQVDAGITAVLLAGTTGESATLTDEEKMELIYRCKQRAGNSCLILAGTGSNHTTHAMELSKAAEEAGADGLLVVSPYYNKSTADGLVAHYMAIAHSVSVPIVLYNVPSRTGLDIPVSVYKRLSVIPNIVGVKEASTDITKILRIRQSCPEDFTIWAGNDDQIVPVLSLGGKGVFSVLSNLLPEQTAAMTNAALDGDFDTAAALQAELLPLIDLLFCEVNPIPVKAAMEIIGYDCGKCRLPLSQLSLENRKRLTQYLQ